MLNPPSSREKPARVHLFIFMLCLTLGHTLPGVTSAETTTHPVHTTSGNSAARSDLLRLMTYIRELPMARERVAPVENSTTGGLKVQVNFSLLVASIIDVADVRQSMTSISYLLTSWYDRSLTWNVSDYGGIESLEIPIQYIWSPGIGIGNSLNFRNVYDVDDLMVFVRHDGLVSAKVIILAETLCHMDLTYYPFDTQTCPQIFLAFSDVILWNFPQVYELEQGKEIARKYAIGAEWELVGTDYAIEAVEDFDEEGAIVTIQIKRKTTFYTVCLILPMVVTSYMNTLVFLLPLQSGEKISFLVSIFVSTSVFVSYFTSVMPRGLNSVPNTMKLLIGVIGESVIVLLATIIVLRCDHLATTRDATDPEREATRDFNCSARKSRVHDNQVNVLPLPEGTIEEKKVCADAEESKNAGTILTRSTAEKLDRLFFVVLFVSNTIFLAVLLSQSVSS